MPSIDTLVEAAVEMAHDKISSPTRRLIYGHVINKGFPSKLVDPNNNLSEAEDILRSGKGMFAVIRHFSEADFMTFTAAMATHSEVMRSVPCVAPVAQHMIDRFGLPRLARFSEVDLVGTVTPDTKEKEKDYKKRGKEIKWDTTLPVGYGQDRYLDVGYEAALNGGIVMLGQQPFRTPKLMMPEKNLIEVAYKQMDRKYKAGQVETNEKGVVIDKEQLALAESMAARLGIMIVDLQIPGVEDYSKKSGLNLFFTRYDVILRAVMEMPELLVRAQNRGRRLDEEIYYLMKGDTAA